MPRKRFWYWVGWKIAGTSQKMEPFVTEHGVRPTEAGCGQTYVTVWGPFRFWTTACVAAMFGEGNPHMQHVDQVQDIVDDWKTTHVYNIMQATTKYKRKVFVPVPE